MAKFLQWSDLHCEWGTEDNPVAIPLPGGDIRGSDIDAIIIAGDLNARGRTVETLVEIQEIWGVPVVFVPGNHDFYYMDFEGHTDRMKAEAAEARARKREVHVLDRDELVIAGTRILGATLWTDFAIAGGDAEKQMLGARYVMNDYKKIFHTEDGRLLLPEDTRDRHLIDREWLVAKLGEAFEGPTAVVTHHLPVPEALSARARKGDYAPGYVSDLRADILDKKFDVWFSGHTHQSRCGLLQGLHGPLAFSANMKGYPTQYTDFDPYRIFDTENPTAGLKMIDIEDPALRGLPSADMVLKDLLAHVVTADDHRGAPSCG